MATVEQRDTQPSGLAALSNTLDIFNDFKDEKDSDEESFHLPMLDCDDDLDSNNKENITNSIDKDVQCQNGETEDEILNKFETTITPDIDPKIEDKLLDEIDELCEKKPDEESVKTSSSDKVTSQDLQIPEENKFLEKVEEEVNEKLTIENQEADTDKQAINEVCLNLPEVVSTNNAEEKEKVMDEQQVNEDKQTDEKLITEEAHTIKEQFDDEINQSESKNDNAELSSNDAVIDEPVKENESTQVTENSTEEKDNNENKNITNEDIEMDVVTPNNLKEKPTDSAEINEVAEDEIEEDIKGETKETEARNSEMQIEPLKEINQVDAETTNHSSEIFPKEIENENILKLDTEPESMDVDILESDGKEDTNNESIQNDNKKVDSPEENTGKNIDDSLIKTSTESDKSDENRPLEENNSCTTLDQKEIIKPEVLTTLDQSIKPSETIHSKSDEVAPESCENSNDSNKNLDCEDDLLDISIIRDVDEDNASAIAENANDNQSSEKSDNDDQEEESEKAENELEESEMDQDETLLANDKDDRMDFDDGNSSLAYQDNTVSGNTSDSEAKDDYIRDSENDSNNSCVLKEKTNRINDNILDSEKNQTDEIRTEMKDTDSQSVSLDDQDSLKENSVKLGGKRSSSETELTAASNKKIKLSDTVVVNEKKKTKKFKTLLTFEKFMQNKKIESKLTRSDLEQFCLQKICEAIVHKTDVGELHQTIKKQEQIIENLRKDLQQLTKQTRDLDIVNKKLMNELRAQNGIKKPLVPLKITRSVGLQVKLNIGIDNNNTRRKTPVTVNSRTPNTNNTPRQRPIVPANANVVRQIATASPRKTPTSTPLLSQALQTSRQVTPTATKRPQIRPKPTEPQKPATPGVIDLTDEDDKAAKAATGTPIKMINKTIPLSQAKSINIIQNKSVPTKTINTINQNKTVAIGQVKTATAGAKVATPTRTVTTLPQGVRLTPTQVKNGSITIPASVVTSSAGTTQLMYVVQPTSSLGQVVTSTAGGAQKAVLLNFQSANGVLTSALNGSAVSVIPTKTTNTVQLKTVAAPRKHPAPLPLPPSVAVNASLKPLLPKPHLSIRKTDTGIILQWRMPYNLDIYEGIASYQLFAYQETNAAPSTDMWRKVGDVKALALPMACTLTQFADKNKYYFAVRSVDVHKRIGAFSDPEEISL